MTTPTLKLYPSATLEKDELEQILEKNLNDVNTFSNSNNNFKEIITYFKDNTHKSKKRYKSYKTPNTILESLDTIVNIGAKSTSITLSITGVGLIVVPISAGVACVLWLGGKVI